MRKEIHIFLLRWNGEEKQTGWNYCTQSYFLAVDLSIFLGYEQDERKGNNDKQTKYDWNTSERNSWILVEVDPCGAADNKSATSLSYSQFSYFIYCADVHNYN